MNKKQLIENIQKKESFLCVGLDPDIEKIPKHLLKDENPVLSFNKKIIEATQEYCVAYKPNVAFYECMGSFGWETLKHTMASIPEGFFTIADAKRGDIGNTSTMYARTFFSKSACGFSFDGLTVAPYMGEDSVRPFLDFKDKWLILLALTSNEGSKDFQLDFDQHTQPLYKKVINKARSWASSDQLMFVVGATRTHELLEIRKLAPDNFLLAPGVGKQAGSLHDVAKYGINKDAGLLVNASRSILYASSGEDFADQARQEAKKLQQEMSRLLDKYRKQ